jgi:hypothetical protein
MTMLRTMLWTVAGVSVLGALGCDLYMGGQSRHEPVYVAQGPQYYEQQPQYVIVDQAPPPVRIERRSAPPGPNYIWIDGYWNWSNQRYSWEAGRYVVPPQPDVVWVPARYDADGRSYRYSPGTWAKQNQGNGRGRGGGRDGRD